MNTRIGEFDYTLPKELIAQHPEKERASSRLLVLHRESGEIEHRQFLHIVDYFRKGDVLVLNDSKVFPARLKAVKETGGAIDILLVEKKSMSRWTCLARGVKKGVDRLKVSVGSTFAELFKDRDESLWAIEFAWEGDSYDIIRKYGTMPLPNYIKRKGDDGPEDFERYQTVYADHLGSIAAPTAGFHFTEDVIKELENKGVFVVKVTLHIGVGTFFLVKTEMVEDHDMHREYYSLSREAKSSVSLAKEQGRRVTACGTSAVRTLETSCLYNGSTPLAGYTDLFIYPGYSFKVVDALITNFHLPRSTPLLLASAFAGKEKIKKCYKEAIERGYRFYSYGDAMLVI